MLSRNFTLSIHSNRFKTYVIDNLISHNINKKNKITTTTAQQIPLNIVENGKKQQIHCTEDALWHFPHVIDGAYYSKIPLYCKAIWFIKQMWNYTHNFLFQFHTFCFRTVFNALFFMYFLRPFISSNIIQSKIELN